MTGKQVLGILFNDFIVDIEPSVGKPLNFEQVTFRTKNRVSLCLPGAYILPLTAPAPGDVDARVIWFPLPQHYKLHSLHNIIVHWLHKLTLLLLPCHHSEQRRLARGPMNSRDITLLLHSWFTAVQRTVVGQGLCLRIFYFRSRGIFFTDLIAQQILIYVPSCGYLHGSQFS